MRKSSTTATHREGNTDVVVTTTVTTLADGSKKTVVTEERIERPPANAPRFCVHCGAATEVGGRFCVSCGARIDGGAAAQPAATSRSTAAAVPASSSSRTTHRSPAPSSSSSHTQHDTVHLTPLGQQLKQMILNTGSSAPRNNNTSSHSSYSNARSPPSSSSSSNRSHSSSSSSSRLSCKTCGIAIHSGQRYVERKGKIYCEAHGYEKCKACKGQLVGQYVKDHSGRSYHQGCFRCVVCQTPLGLTFYPHPSTGKPVCAKHK